MYEFTSESVSNGHPDKIADLISDTVATFIIDGNINNRAAVETLVTTNMVTVAGEYKSDKLISKEQVESLIRKVVKEIGYEQDGFHWETLVVYNELHGQSADIALGTDDFGAGDQGIMFGYACDETDNFMPSTIHYSHKILQALEEARRNGADWLGPDAKSQVTFAYEKLGEPAYIKTVVCSTQHSDELSIEEVRERVTDIILPVIKDKVDLLKTVWHINPTGKFVIGGPDGDTGLTGRKIIVDTYGGYAPHGGGAFSGKDCTKVDRSGAYMARYLAKNVVASGKAKNCVVQLSYAIGVKEPTSIYVYADGIVRKEFEDYFRENVDLTPLGIIKRFDLFNLDLTKTTNYGHFGKDELPWESVDLFKN
jgi:S-adenosylmethionine synthetase